MGNRLKQVREELVDKQKRLDEIEAKCSADQRGWNDEERTEVDQIEKDIDNLIKERELLEKQAKRKEQLAKEELERKGKEDEVESRDGKPEVEVTAKNLKTKEARNAKIFSMIQGTVNQNPEQVREASKALREGGWYDDRKEERAFQTLTDEKGGILLPTTVSSDIMNIAQNYGVVPQFAMNLGNIIQNEVKVPQVLGRPTFSAVNQRSAISGSGFNLGGVTLKAHKWGTIIDWTNEVDESVGATILPIVFEQIAEAWAYTLDNTFFNGDGTSTYNNIKGLEELEGSVNYVQRTTAATGNTAFATVDATDYNSAIYDVTPGARSGAIWVMHPNMIEHLHNLQDGQGKYIYGDPSEVRPVGSLWGYRIATSEAFPFTDGTSKTVAAFFNPRYLAFATGRALTATRLTEGSITDEDGNSVNLATMDAQAIRWTGLFDMVLSSVTRTTAGTAQGAFSVLRTAAS